MEAMPNEHRKRGQRGQKKRKRGEDEGQQDSKRRKSHEQNEPDVEIVVGGQQDNKTGFENGEEYVPLIDEPFGYGVPGSELPDSGEIPFYGLLDEQEQEYFKQADSILALDQFADPAEKSLFLENIYKEAQGRELKIANSQSCSRLMERLIAASSAKQLKNLWNNFSGHFLYLFQHRFASHCCESLFRYAAPVIRHESARPHDEAAELDEDGKPEATFECLFLSCVEELKGNFGYLITNPHASHPLRVLLIILSGMSSTKMDNPALMQSKKKENSSVNEPLFPKEFLDETSAMHNTFTPASFHQATSDIILETTASLDSTAIRALSKHPIANPVLQILLIVSLTNSSSKQQVAKDSGSLFRKILPDEDPVDGTESATFIVDLMYDSVGSRLVEALVSHCPAKTFRTLYRAIFMDRLPSLARNDIASFVLLKVLERLGKDDLEAASSKICEGLETLVTQSRYNVIKTLIERCRVRGVDESHIAEVLRTVYGADDATRIDKMMKLTSDALPSSNDQITQIPGNHLSHRNREHPEDDKDGDSAVPHQKNKKTPADNDQTHASLLAQTMLSAPGPLRALITDSLLALPPSTLQAYSKSRATSQIIQTALVQPTDQPPSFRRQLIPRFCSSSAAGASPTDTGTNEATAQGLPDQTQDNSSILADLSTHPIGSHVLDALWEATSPTPSLPPANASSKVDSRSSSGGLPFLRERIANALLPHEHTLKDTLPGRIVWRNWKMDLFKRGDTRAWSSSPSSSSSHHVGDPSATGSARTGLTAGAASAHSGVGCARGKGREREKTGIELARERYAKAKASSGGDRGRMVAELRRLGGRDIRGGGGIGRGGGRGGGGSDGFSRGQQQGRSRDGLTAR